MIRARRCLHGSQPNSGNPAALAVGCDGRSTASTQAAALLCMLLDDATRDRLAGVDQCH